jgi:hypothetical protein
VIDHTEFLACLHARRRMRVVFVSEKDGGAVRERICAPLDCGPDKRASDDADRYRFYDLERRHPLKKFGHEIVGLEAMNEFFDPSSILTWGTRAHPWWIARDWGAYS